MEDKFKSIPATEVKVGDIITVNTGYKPFDDEHCEVFEVEKRKDCLFDTITNEICFFIKSYRGNHWYQVPEEMVYGPNRYKTTILTLKKEDIVKHR